MVTINPQPIASVVNDDPSQLRLAASILARDGYEVLACLSAEEALRRLSQRGRADVIITDLYMPGIDGWRLCRLLRSSAYKAFNAIPILVVSATFSGADAEELTAQLGADGFLSAPYEARVLRQMVRDLLGNGKPKSPTHVLVVEPDPAEAEVLMNTFSSQGYAAARAADGAEAERRLRASRPQLVILNYDLPDMSGSRLLRAIKEPAATTVTIVLTTDTSAERVAELLRLGADNYAPKPVLPEYLLHLYETASRQRALLRVEELLELRTRRLRDSEERYRNLFENAGDGIMTYTLDGVVIGVNRELEALARASRNDLVGKSYGRLMTSASLADAAALQEQARAKKATSWIYETGLVHPDGAVVPVEAHCRFLAGRDAQPSIIMAKYRDITAKKNLDRQRAEFTAMLAHDIRNPVGLILGCTELLLNDAAPPLDAATIRKCHQRIRDHARVLESLVSNYLDVSRIEAGQLQLSKQRLDLSRTLNRIVGRYQCEAEPRAIRLEFSQADPTLVEGDALALERVFANLLHNALKFTPDGGAISVSLERCSAHAAVSVRDSGPGIDPQKLPALFQKFNRIEITERQGGLGLGLFIVRELVVAHGGRVEVESVLGQGSCFSVILPLARTEPKGT